MADRLIESFGRRPDPRIADEFVLWTLDEEPPQKKWLPKFVTDNFAKLQAWQQFVERQVDGEQVCFIDADCLILGDLAPAFDDPYDVAYTVRPGRIPFNSGVVFVRVNERSREFFRHWVNFNLRIVKNEGLSLADLREFAGGNQWAMADCFKLVEAGKLDCQLKKLPCRIWNCEQETWSEFDEDETRILHVKGALREWLLRHQPPPEDARESLRKVLPVAKKFGW